MMLVRLWSGALCACAEVVFFLPAARGLVLRDGRARHDHHRSFVATRRFLSAATETASRLRRASVPGELAPPPKTNNVIKGIKVNKAVLESGLMNGVAAQRVTLAPKATPAPSTPPRGAAAVSVAKGIENSLKAKLRFLQRRLSLNPDELQRLAVKFPKALSYSVDQLGARVEDLVDRLDLDDAGLHKLASRFPAVLAEDEAVEVKFEFLEDRLQLSPDQAGTVVLALCPQLFGYSIAYNLEPTVCFYEEALALDPEGLAAFFTRFPSALGRSLNKRLRPRHDRCLEAGVPVDLKTMRYIMVEPDSRFDLWLIKQADLEKQQAVETDESTDDSDSGNQPPPRKAQGGASPKVDDSSMMRGSFSDSDRAGPLP